MSVGIKDQRGGIDEACGNSWLNKIQFTLMTRIFINQRNSNLERRFEANQQVFLLA